MYRYVSKTNGLTYKLCRTSITLRGGKEAIVYYFIGEEQKLRKCSHYAEKLPSEYEIRETKSGHPLPKKQPN